MPDDAHFRRSARRKRWPAASRAPRCRPSCQQLSESKKLEQTYVPVQVEMVRRADAARREGRKALRANKTG